MPTYRQANETTRWWVGGWVVVMVVVVVTAAAAEVGGHGGVRGWVCRCGWGERDHEILQPRVLAPTLLQLLRVVLVDRLEMRLLRSQLNLQLLLRDRLG